MICLKCEGKVRIKADQIWLNETFDLGTGMFNEQMVEYQYECPHCGDRGYMTGEPVYGGVLWVSEAEEEEICSE